jgi:3-isopropylmalate dehydrogenase
MGQRAPRVTVLAGDGIGPEVTAAAIRVLSAVRPDIAFTGAPIGAAAIDATGDALPDATLELCDGADALLLGAVGSLISGSDGRMTPEQALLRLRHRFELFANIRPAFSFPFTPDCSPLRETVCRNVDMVIVRELLGGLYYGEKRTFSSGGVLRAVDTLEYSDVEIRRTAIVAFELARSRRRRVVSIDKQNVLASSRLWRETVNRVAMEFPDVELEHMLVDRAAMELAKSPGAFDVIVTENMFGDILSDEAGAIVGTIGVLPSASLGTRHNSMGLPFGLYEPISGSAPDIAGRGIANPVGAMLSGALLLRHSLGDAGAAHRISSAVMSVYGQGWSTSDIRASGYTTVGTTAFTDKVLAALM